MAYYSFTPGITILILPAIPFKTWILARV